MSLHLSNLLLIWKDFFFFKPVRVFSVNQLKNWKFSKFSNFQPLENLKFEICKQANEENAKGCL